MSYEKKNYSLFATAIISGMNILQNIGQFVINNPEKTVAIFGSAVALLNATKSLHVTHRNKVENRVKEHTYYDPHTGMRWDLRRRMTNNDRIYISTETKKGRPMEAILRDRGLI